MERSSAPKSTSSELSSRALKKTTAAEGLLALEIIGGRDLLDGEVAGVHPDELPDAGVGPDGEGDEGREHDGLLRGADDVAEEALGEPGLLDLVVALRRLELLHQLLVLHQPPALGDIALEAPLHLVASLAQRLGHHVGDAVGPPEGHGGGGGHG